jgi:hypothetical protein
MKRIAMALAAIPALALVAAAQDENGPRQIKIEVEHMVAQSKTVAAGGAVTEQSPEAAKLQMRAIEKMVAESKVMGITGAAMGATVKGAPYSGTEVAESTQVLADGTRIHNERQTAVYRDSEGRVRRETPDQTTIWDPVANVSYILDPKSQTAHKVTMTRTFVLNTTGGAVGMAGARSTFEVHATQNGVTSVMVDGKPADPTTIKMDQLPGITYERRMSSADPAPAAPGTAAAKWFKEPGQSESLGKQTIEGVNSEGTRSTTTLEAGAIGNDRPIQIVSERWYSPELQTVTMTRRNDPRSGEEIFRLTGVSRAEPASYLFLVPAGYQLQEPK